MGLGVEGEPVGDAVFDVGPGKDGLTRGQAFGEALHFPQDAPVLGQVFLPAREVGPAHEGLLHGEVGAGVGQEFGEEGGEVLRNGLGQAIDQYRELRVDRIDGGDVQAQVIAVLDQGHGRSRLRVAPIGAKGLVAKATIVGLPAIFSFQGRPAAR